ncbi:MAG: DNA gyrase inhibitor YacG [Candidatus Hinthialibacter antarcticus]|nr:DNA gyrase inhibitor YacG [Candidatus Hinthialibacter antarcticus]
MANMASIHCRTCGKALPEGTRTPTFPFCSMKCKMVDLGHWFNGDYHISEPLPREEDDHDADAEFGLR